MPQAGPLLLAAVLSGAAQTPPGAAREDKTPPPPRAELTVGYEARRDRLRYRFDNPSSWDTPFLVPHFFEQRYTGDNHWLVARARYRVAGRPWQTEFAVAPDRTTFGSDYDTFFQPTGDVVRSGTEGDVTLRSFRVAQRVAAGTVGGAGLRVGYTFRRERSHFHPQPKTVTHTSPASRDVTFETTRESTTSDVHEVTFGLQKLAEVGEGWRLRAEADVAPTTLARLATVLPDKYPGQDIVFLAKAVTLTTRLAVSRVRGRWPIEVAFDYGRAWSWKSSSQLHRDLLGVSVTAGRAW